MDCAGLLPVLDALLVVATCPERERDQDDHEHERDLQTEATPGVVSVGLVRVDVGAYRSRRPRSSSRAQSGHADGCSDPFCEGLDAPGRPELSFECWEQWSAESHDWSDERDEDDVTPTEDDITDLAVEQVVAAWESRGEI